MVEKENVKIAVIKCRFQQMREKEDVGKNALTVEVLQFLEKCVAAVVLDISNRRYRNY